MRPRHKSKVDNACRKTFFFYQRLMVSGLCLQLIVVKTPMSWTDSTSPWPPQLMEQVFVCCWPSPNSTHPLTMGLPLRTFTLGFLKSFPSIPPQRFKQTTNRIFQPPWTMLTPHWYMEGGFLFTWIHCSMCIVYKTILTTTNPQNGTKDHLCIYSALWCTNCVYSRNMMTNSHPQKKDSFCPWYTCVNRKYFLKTENCVLM